MKVSESFKNMFSPLCSTKEDLGILENLCSKVVSIEEGIISFEDFEITFEINPDIVPSNSLPKSFGEIAQVATTITWDGGGPEVGFGLDEDGETFADGWLLAEIELGDENPELIKPAFLAGQNGLFFDGNRKLLNGEPALAFISHEGGDLEPVSSVDNLDYKQIFLRMISDAVLETNFIEEIYF